MKGYDFIDFTDWDVKIGDPKFELMEQVLIPAIEKQIGFNDHIINKISKYDYQS